MSDITILRGESVTVNSTFRRNIQFSSAPTWILYDWNDEPLQSGTATPGDANSWDATITINANMQIPDGAQPLVLEYSVIDTSNVEHSLQRIVTVVDDFPNDAPYGLLWYAGRTTLSDTVLLPRAASNLEISLVPGWGTAAPLSDVTIASPVPASTTDRGVSYNWQLTDLPVQTTSASGYYAYQLQIVASYTDGTEDIITRPVYGMTRLTLSRLTSMRRFLDKGRFSDIDPRLQWADEELVHFLYDGVQFINGFGNAMTFWTVDSLPSPMDSALLMAAEWQALNARYQAEGYSTFQFNSGGVDLNFDRTQFIATKMEELYSAVTAMLQQSKASAVRQFGPGTPAAGVPSKGSIGALGITLGPCLNRTARYSIGYGIGGGRSFIGN